MKSFKFATLALCGLLTLGSCNLNNTVKGGGIGALAGTLAGGVIGKIAGNTAVGAAVGAVAGTTAGALIGKHMDKVKAKAAAVENAKVEEVLDNNKLKAVKVTFDSGILFATGKYDLNSASRQSLRTFAQVLINDPQLSVDIQGHTDSTGSDRVNNPLSQNRAEAVASYLIDCGVPASQFQYVTGFGSKYPVVSNATAAGKQQNRRVEILLYASEAMVNAAQSGNLN